MRFSILILLLIPFLLNAQDFQINNPGVRARSMAGAYIGIADDITAVFYNPAGLSLRKDHDIYFSRGIEKYCITSDIDKIQFNTAPWESRHCFHDFGGIKFAFPFFNKSKKLMTAFSIQKLVDFFSQYQRKEFSKKQSGGINSYSLSFAYYLIDSLYIGLSVNYYHGKRNFEFTDNFNGDWGGDAKESYDYSGFGIPNIGALWYFKPFKIGVTIKFPFKLKEQSESQYCEATIQMPSIVGIGGAFDFNDNLILSADVEWQEYSNVYRKYDKSNDPFQIAIEKQRIGFINVWQVRCGSEYSFDSRWFKIPVRIGVAYMPKSYVDTNDKRIKGSLASFGAGIVRNHFASDVCLEYDRYPYNIPNEGKYWEHYLKFLFSFTIRF